MTAITDQSASELRANLPARREWAASATGWVGGSSAGYWEVEDELRAHGELPEPGPPRPQPGVASEGRLPDHAPRENAYRWHPAG